MESVDARGFSRLKSIRRSKGAKIGAVLVIIMLIITIFPHHEAGGGGPGGIPLYVDIGAVINGTPFSFTYTGYNFTGMDMNNRTDGVVMVNFSYPGNSIVMLSGQRIGTLVSGNNATFILNMSAGSTINLKYQGIDGLIVTVENFSGGDLSIPDGGAFITGNTILYGSTYRANYNFQGNQGYNISSNMSSNISYIGIVDESIVALGNGTSNFSLPASAGSCAVTLILFSDQEEYFELQVNVTDSMFGNGSIPTNVNGNISIDDGLITISANTPSEFDDLSLLAYIVDEALVAENVTMGYTLEDEYPYLNMTKHNWDVWIKRDKYTSEVVEINAPFRQAYLTATYTVEFRNDNAFTTNSVYPGQMDYWMAGFSIQDVVYDTLTIDEDGDGYPHIEFLAHDVFIEFIDNGSNFTVGEGSSFHLSPFVFENSNQPDDNDTCPGVPNEAADSDYDNLSIAMEVYNSGTDPLNSNSDGIGFDDWLDIFESSTNDTDGDGLNDSFEIELGTNPLKRDTDYDFFDDGAEYYYWTQRGFNISADLDQGNLSFLLDWDSDIGTNISEDGELWHSYFYMNLTWTNRSVWGVLYNELDGIEVRRLGTDPAVTDTDNDTLSDGIEARYWSLSMAA